MYSEDQGIALSYRKVDAFTSGKSLGNPVACIFISIRLSYYEGSVLFGGSATLRISGEYHI